MSTNSQSKKDLFAGLNMPIDQKPLPSRDILGANNANKEKAPEKLQEQIPPKTQTHKNTNTQRHKNTRKEANTNGNVQETLYISPEKKTKIAVLTALLGKPKGVVLEEGIDYVLDKYKHLLKGL